MVALRQIYETVKVLFRAVLARFKEKRDEKAVLPM